MLHGLMFHGIHTPLHGLMFRAFHGLSRLLPASMGNCLGNCVHRSNVTENREYKLMQLQHHGDGGVRRRPNLSTAKWGSHEGGNR